MIKPLSFSRLWAAYRRRRLAYACAKRIHRHLTVQVERHIAYAIAKQAVSEEEINRVRFWMRSAKRYHRISIGQNPWRNLPLAQD